MRKLILLGTMLTVVGVAFPGFSDSLLPRGARRFHAMRWMYARPGYFGFGIKPMLNLKDAGTHVVTFGIDGGYKWFGFGLRYGYSSNVHYLIPELRFQIPMHLGRRLYFIPFTDISPMLMFSSGSTGLQMVVRPGVRFTLQINPNFGVYIEPFALGIGVHTWYWSDSVDADSSTTVLRYTLGFGFEYRFR